MTMHCQHPPQHTHQSTHQHILLLHPINPSSNTHSMIPSLSLYYPLGDRGSSSMKDGDFYPSSSSSVQPQRGGGDGGGQGQSRLDTSGSKKSGVGLGGAPGIAGSNGSGPGQGLLLTNIAVLEGGGSARENALALVSGPASAPGSSSAPGSRGSSRSAMLRTATGRCQHTPFHFSVE